LPALWHLSTDPAEVVATLPGRGIVGLEERRRRPHRAAGWKIFAEQEALILELRRLRPASASRRHVLTQPGLPMNPGRAGTMTHDYIRNGTTTLFAALNVFDQHNRPISDLAWPDL
jgi:hypothetical protein